MSQILPKKIKKIKKRIDDIYQVLIALDKKYPSEDSILDIYYALEDMLKILEE